MEDLTRRNFMKGSLIGIMGASTLLANDRGVKDINEEEPANIKTNTEERESKVNALKPGSFLYNCFMDVQKFNYDRGMLSKEKYDQIRKSPVVTQKVGRRIYFGTA